MSASDHDSKNVIAEKEYFAGLDTGRIYSIYLPTISSSIFRNSV